MNPGTHRDPVDAKTHDALCAALRGEAVDVSDAVVDLARRHRVHLLLAHAGHARCSGDARAALAADLRQAAAADLLRERELKRVLRWLAGANIEVLLLKGAGLAYCLYESPHLRWRGDVDLLVRRDDVDAADRALTSSGWRPIVEQNREAATSQRHYVSGEGALIAEQIDLHWKIAVPRVFDAALGFDEMSSRAVAIPALGPAARTPGIADALFLACVHRVAHHYDAVDLLWLWDIHQLVSRLEPADEPLLIELATTRSMRAVCARGVELASLCFATPGAPQLIARLRPSAGDPPERSARFLRGGVRQVDVLRGDLAVLTTWRARVELVAAHLFPSADYMRAKYPRWPVAALPIAYVDRIVRGAPGWFRGSDE